MWNQLSPVMGNKVHELMASMRFAFFYKIADRIGTKMLEDEHGNELTSIALLLAALFIVLFVWEQIGEALYNTIERFHEENKHAKTTVDFIKGGPDSEATFLAVIYAPTVLFLMFLTAVILWLGQMFSVVVGNYITHFSEDYTAFDAVPITLAVGGFLLLAKFVIDPKPKRKIKEE